MSRRRRPPRVPRRSESQWSDDQLRLPFGPVLNSELFSNYWLEKRLPLEPEWVEFRAEAEQCLQQLLQLWRVQKDRVERYGDEAGLEEAFIQPVLETLGWKIKYQAFLQGREPDYALFLDDRDLDSALAAGRTSPHFWDYPAGLADAKAWHVSLDRPIQGGARREYPPQQIERYLDQSRTKWAVLTNGRLWRLIPRERPPGKPRFRTFFQIDLPALLAHFASHQQRTLADEHLKEFRYFFLFFAPRGFRANGRAALLDRALSGSSEYAVGVSQNLRGRVFDALQLCIEGFLTFPENSLQPADDLQDCREESLILLYRLLFVMYGEDRGLLPYRKNRTYTNNRSLARLRAEISVLSDRASLSTYSRQQTAIWTHLADLFDLINHGHATYGVPAYNGGLFDPEKHPFLATKKISDFYLASVIDKLGRAPDVMHTGPDLYHVDYRDLAIQQLGSVYEGLLELQPHWASEAMVMIRSRDDSHADQIVPVSEPIPRGWDRTQTVYPRRTVYLTTMKDERRASGSYYTPDHVVQEIINRTLRPLCEDIDRQLHEEVEALERQLVETSNGNERDEINRKLAGLRLDFAPRVLRLRVLDPAMGSGHFLVRACQSLAEEIATHPYTPDLALRDPNDNEATLVYWKRQVVERSIFGIDLNPLAVELAKLALWLDTASTDRPLTFLDHHLRPGDSLVGGRVDRLGTLPGDRPLLQNDYAQRVEDERERLLQPLADIESLSSDNERDIKEKDRIFRRVFRPTQQAFARVADVWCSTFFLGASQRVTDEEYERLITALGHRSDLNRLLQAPRIAAAIETVKTAFHWEIEFPKVFSPSGSIAGGFDAVIGNPPYDVLAQLEVGRDLTGFREFIKFDSTLRPSQRGKNNLYKLFLCRGLELLRPGGYMGFVVPMPLLGDDQALGIRSALLSSGHFTQIDAFPQKDDSKARLFQEAKLSTVVFGYQKTIDRDNSHEPFQVRTHQRNTFDLASKAVRLTAAEVRSYDPDNLTIVSCSQADWDLVTRLLGSGKCTRLGRLCTSYQGEINETTDGRAGCISEQPSDGPLILRGANISLYAVRPASQGEDRYLRVRIHQNQRSQSVKATHAEDSRVGFQRSSPQNNFRRLIAAPLSPGSHCFDTVSYIPKADSRLPLNVLLGLLNSKLFEWYFRLGSTNSKVNEYQFVNLPCPSFRPSSGGQEARLLREALPCVASRNADHLRELLASALDEAPVSEIVADVIGACVDEIGRIESERGDVAKAQRSKLAPESQVLQTMVDELVFRAVGLSHGEQTGIEERLLTML